MTEPGSRMIGLKMLLDAKTSEAAAQSHLGNEARAELCREEAHALLDAYMRASAENIQAMIRDAQRRER